MADERPTTLKLDMLELTVLESVEITMQERGGSPAEPQVAGDPNFMISPMEPAALSGFAPCE
jgi:hypothetical protein